MIIVEVYRLGFFVYHCTLALRNASLDISNIQQHDVVAVMLQCCIL